jgi:hypothetical protein
MAGMGKKADIHTTNTRVNRLCSMLVRGWTTREIIQYAAKEWGLGDRQVYILLKRARARLVEDANVDRQEMLAAKIQTLDLVIRKATDAEQYNNVIGAIRLLCELTGTGYSNSQKARQ